MTVAERIASYTTLLDALADAPAEAPFVTVWDPRAAVAERTVTYREFLRLADDYAHLYLAHGLKAGDTVVLVMPQGLPLLAAFVGALFIGAIPAILAYPTFKIEPEKYRQGLTGVTKNLGARLVVIDDEFPPDVGTEIHGAQLLTLDAGALGEAKRPVKWAMPPADAVAFIQHSAGTTGLQKGVALSHRAVLNQLAVLSEAQRLDTTDRFVSWLPLYHDMGLIACFVLPLVAHVPVVMESPTDWVLWPGSFLRLASDYRCTLCWLPNFAFQFLARRVPAEERASLDLSALRAAINCSEPVRAESMEEFYAAYRSVGIRRAVLQSCYAMAENTFAVTQSRLNEREPATIFADRDAAFEMNRVVIVPESDERACIFVSSGRCLAGNDVRVVDDSGRDVPDGTIGEVLVRSNSLLTGYYNRPDLTAKALRDGWYWTADSGFLLDSELYVLGRKDDVIIVGGKNLYPQDIEEVAAEHPDVHDGRVVAIGLFNPALGTQDLVVICEVRDEQCLSRTAAIQTHIRQRILAEFSVAPRLVHVVAPRWIIKSTAGKPARSATRRKLIRDRPEFAYAIELSSEAVHEH